MLSQIRYVDGKRMKHQLSVVSKENFNIILEKLFCLIKNNP